MSMRFVLDKSKWLRGSVGRLLRDDGLMCCLGQLAKQCGADDAALFRAAALRDLRRCPKQLSGLAFVDAIRVNDDPLTTDAEKIELLRPIFASRGFELEVVEGT